MEILAARFTLAAAVLAALPCFAAEPAQAPRAPAPTPVLDAVRAAAVELQAAAGKGNAIKRLDALAAFKPTPGTAEKLVKVFGNDHPFTVTRVAGPKAQAVYRFGLQPLDYTGEDDTHTSWTELAILANVGNGGRAVTMQGQWDALAIEDKLMRTSVHGMRLEGKQALGAGGLWFGKAQFDIDGATFAAKAIPGAEIALEQVRIATSTAQRAKVMDVHYGVAVKSVTAFGEQVDDFRLATRVTNLGIKQMAEFQAASEQAGAGQTPAQRMETMQASFKRFAKGAMASGSAIEIDDLSMRYRGNTASLKGHVGFEGAAAGEADTLPAMLKKIAARFDVRVPVALLQDVTRAIARKQASAGRPANEQAIEQVAQSMTDVVLGRLLGGGYARIEDGVLVSVIEIKDGKLRVNGKEIAFPTVSPAAPGAPPRTPPGASYMPARRMEGSCTLPPYPDEVLRQNLPLAMTARFIVGFDGRVRDVILEAPSAWPEFDRAALAAMATCSYAPALHNGQPFDSPLSWKVVRDPAQEAPAGTENPAR